MNSGVSRQSASLISEQVGFVKLLLRSRVGMSVCARTSHTYVHEDVQGVVIGKASVKVRCKHTHNSHPMFA